MKITPVKTSIVHPNDDITTIISDAIPHMQEGSILAVTSKIVSLCEGRVYPAESRTMEQLIDQEADAYLPQNNSQYGTYLTIKGNHLIPNAGIDYSNAHHSVLLWPKNLQESANRLYDFLKSHYMLKRVGVIITDSAPSPLQWGVTGIAIAHSGFKAVLSKEGTCDLFGRRLTMTKINTANALAAAAVLCMGEGNECTPLAIIEEPMNTIFEDHHPTEDELAENIIDPKDDLYARLLTAVKWKSRK